MKTLFTLKTHSLIDVVTNSSSELFVGNSDSKDKIIELIETVYPNYLNEYEEVKKLEDFSIEDLDSHMNWITGSWQWPAKKSNYKIPKGFTFDELYEPDGKEPAWNSEVQYELKNNNVKSKSKWDNSFVTEDNFEEIKNKLDPNKEMYFLFSISENPDWEMQEALSTIMTRHHLGLFLKKIN